MYGHGYVDEFFRKNSRPPHNRGLISDIIIYRW